MSEILTEKLFLYLLNFTERNNSKIESCKREVLINSINIESIKKDIESIKEDLERLEKEHHEHKASTFIKKNWWKIGAFILAWSSILEWIADIIQKVKL